MAQKVYEGKYVKGMSKGEHQIDALIPDNYKIVKENNLYGIIRAGKDGNRVIWNMEYTVLVCARIMGKIMVFSKHKDDQDPGVLLMTYNKKLWFKGRIYDFMFNSESLYVKTPNPKNGELVWVKIVDDSKDSTELSANVIGKFSLAGGKYNKFKASNKAPEPIIMDFTKGREGADNVINFFDTEWYNKFDFILGTDGFYPSVRTLRVIAAEGSSKNEELILNVASGKCCRTEPEKKEPIKDTEAKIEFCEDYIRFVGVQSGLPIIGRSVYINEFSIMKDVITAIAGGLVVDVETAKLLLELLNKFEGGFFGGILLALNSYAKKHGAPKSSRAEYLKWIIKELDSNWCDTDVRGYHVKVYVIDGIIYVLSKVLFKASTIPVWKGEEEKYDRYHIAVLFIGEDGISEKNFKSFYPPAENKKISELDAIRIPVKGTLENEVKNLVVENTDALPYPIKCVLGSNKKYNMVWATYERLKIKYAKAKDDSHTLGLDIYSGLKYASKKKEEPTNCSNMIATNVCG